MAHVIVALVLAGFLAAAQDWIGGGTRDGVTLAFRDDPQLGAREMRAIAELPHAAARIIPVACDFTQQLDPDVKEAKVLSGDLNARYSIYLRYSPRFMVVAARDVVIEVRRDVNGCAWSEVADAAPPRAGTVRMPLLRGSWLIEPLDSTRARVTYQIAVDPGGNIPKWLVRRGAAGALPDVIKRIRHCIDSAAAMPVRCSAQ